MDFTTMGTIGAYLKQKNLYFAANYKIKTGQKMADANGNLNFTKSDVVDTKKKTDEEISTAKLSSIKQKLSSGHRLSDDELIYLQQREPKTYKRAKHAEEAREELKGELKKAKTKQEAKQAVTQALIKASAEASADIADCKSNSSKNSSDAENFTSIQGEVGNNSNAVNLKTAEIFGDTDYQNLDSREDYFSWNYDDEEENFSDVENDDWNNFDDEENFNKNSSDEVNEKNSDSPQEIMEDFISTIRAIEAEWAQFTKSKEYDALPYNKAEEDLLNALGERNNNNFYKETNAPNARVMGAVAAYRAAQNFSGIII